MGRILAREASVMEEEEEEEFMVREGREGKRGGGGSNAWDAESKAVGG